MRYVSLVEYSFMIFDLNYNQPVVKPYFSNIYSDNMNCKLYALSKYDISYDISIRNVMRDISIRYFR